MAEAKTAEKPKRVREPVVAAGVMHGPQPGRVIHGLARPIVRPQNATDRIRQILRLSPDVEPERVLSEAADRLLQLIGEVADLRLRPAD